MSFEKSRELQPVNGWFFVVVVVLLFLLLENFSSRICFFIPEGSFFFKLFVFLADKKFKIVA